MKLASLVRTPTAARRTLKSVLTNKPVLNKVMAIAALSFMGASVAQAIPVLPGASGFGMDTRGARGGKVIRVTNVNASGSGSLKACIDASGPRTCIFDVSGV